MGYPQRPRKIFYCTGRMCASNRRCVVSMSFGTAEVILRFFSAVLRNTPCLQVPFYGCSL